MRSNSLCLGGVGERKASHTSRVELFDFSSDPVHHAYPVPRPNFLQFPGYGTVHAALADPVTPPPPSRHRGNSPLAENAVLPTS